MNGGGGNLPYIYGRPSPRVAYPYSTFNPKAVTQAAYRALEDESRPKPKHEGPLITFDPQAANSQELEVGKNAPRYKTKIKEPVNFNQHPDSWQYEIKQRANRKPMPKRTKTEVAVIRWLQFVLRVLEAIGAIGLLVCVICLKIKPTSLSWISRIVVRYSVKVLVNSS